MLADFLDRGLFPDMVLRWGVRSRCRELLSAARKKSCEKHQEDFEALLAILEESPVAVETASANEQHYELPAAFFEKVLGPRLKYSSCYWEERDDLATAEERMLQLTCARAELADGQRILELGCGWGSLTLFMAENYPSAQITAVSNSRSQREFILKRAREKGLSNVDVLTADMNSFAPPAQYDRIVSVEMFEHLRNYRVFFRRLHTALASGGKIFIHIFAHQSEPFLYDHEVEDNWMARYFFTGGTMPSAQLLPRLAENFRLARHWQVNGKHYEKTLNEWLLRMDQNRSVILPILKATYGKESGAWWARWRLFFLSCAEFFGFDDGNQWSIQHYLFEKL